jgi:predicted NBD/HSP70 family sugar kinase
MITSINHKKNNSQRKIVKNIFFSQELSCNELSTLIGKSIPLTTQYIDEMLKENRLVENGYANSTGGRRPIVYSLPEDIFYIISVAMDQLVTRMVLVSAQNEYVGNVQKVELKLPNNPQSLTELIHHLKSFIKKSKIPAEKIVGIGIGMPGFVDTKKGINHSFLNDSKDSIVVKIEEELNIPVVIDNDSSLIALAELKWGAAKNRNHVMVVNIGWGVGLGIIADGKLFRGNEGFAGEFSHIPLFDNNKACSCGKYGCLETETSMVVVAQNVLQGLKNGKQFSLKNTSKDDIEEVAARIIEAAQKGNKFAIEAISASAYNIGRGVAILIHLLNPELIVISGLGSLAGKVWIAPIQQAINEHCIPKIAEHTEIAISSLGYNAELIGAAALVMENYEHLPAGTKQNFSLNESELKFINKNFS